MPDPATLTLGALAIAAAALVWAAVHDVAARTIPNGLPALIAVVGLGAQAVSGTLLHALAAGALVFAVSGIAWLRGWMGGGDVKLLAAVATLLPASDVPVAMAATALAGAPLALLYLGLRRVVTVPAARPRGRVGRALRAEAWRIRRGGPIPYGVAIACGTLVTVVA
ncbi:MAG: A24 family peptidase [Acetobacteraceae bacterium]